MSSRRRETGCVHEGVVEVRTNLDEDTWDATEHYYHIDTSNTNIP